LPIPYLPDFPCDNNKYLHKEGLMVKNFGSFYSDVDHLMLLPMDIQKAPAVFGENAVKE